MGKIFYLLTLVFILFLSFTLFSCKSDSSTQPSNTIENITVSVKNDSLSIDVEVANTTSNATRNSVTYFSGDSVSISIQASAHSAGHSTFYLVSGLMLPDTLFRASLDSVTSSPQIFRIGMKPNNSFLLNLKEYTGKASVRVTK